MTQQEMIDLAYTHVKKYNEARPVQQWMNPALVCAMCHHESSWNPLAERYEPAFFHRYIEPMHTLVADYEKARTEKRDPIITDAEKEEMRLRATSIGLMQVMGQVAREQGFTGPLTQLHEPETGITEGCKKLVRCMQKYPGETAKQLLMYNGGGAPEYPGLVLQYFDRYKRMFDLREGDTREH